MNHDSISFEKVKEYCSVLEKLAAGFSENSCEYAALNAAALSLINAGMERQEMDISEQRMLLGLDRALATQKKCWLDKNPRAKAGDTAILTGQIYVVTFEKDGRKSLVRVLFDDDNKTELEPQAF